MIDWRLSAGATVLAMVALPGSVRAQDREQVKVSNDPGDIIVTARKRQETLLRTPVVESVITQAQLQQYQIVDIDHVASRVPGLGIGQQTANVGAQVSLRGIGTTTLDTGVDQSVSLNIDGMQFSQGLAFKAGLFDLAQVEVLKGPQALFFGKNSPAGVISLRTADPGQDLEVIGRVGYETEAHQWLTEAIISGPVTPNLGVRLAGSWSDYDGFYKNVAVATPGLGGVSPKGRIGGERSVIVRGTVVWTPTADLDARLKINYTRDKGQGPALQFVSCPEGNGAVTTPPVQFMAGEDCRKDRTVRVVDMDSAAFSGLPYDGRQTYVQRQWFGTLELNYHIQPQLTLSSVTGYYDVKARALFNGSSSPAVPGLVLFNPYSRHDFTQELRLASDYAGPLNFTAGAFYQDASVANTVDLRTNLRVNALVAPFFPPEFTDAETRMHIRAASGFGQVRYKPSDLFEIAAGVRYTDEKRTAAATNFITGTPMPLNLLVDQLHSKNWSPELTVTLTPSADLTIYGSLKQGYKSGSFALSRGAPANSDISFGDEKVQGGELGLKANVLDRSMFVNLAGYYYFYNGLQVGVNTNECLPGEVQPCAAKNLTLNAGAARVYGVDADFTWRPRSLDGLSLRGAANWNHARFVRLENVPCSGGQTAAEGCNKLVGGTLPAQDLSGIPLVRAPNWQFSGGASYELPLGARLKLQLGAEATYTTRYLTQITDRRDSDQSGYAKINATIGLMQSDERWKVSLAGNNLTNRLTTGNCTIAALQRGAIYPGAAGKDEVLCTMDRGRELWMRLEFKL